MSDIVSPDRIPTDIKTEIDNLFPRSEGRRNIAYALMFWNRKPDTKEQEELSVWQGFKGGVTTYTVLTKIKEVGLFTDTVDSVPLSRSLIDIEVEKEQDRIKIRNLLMFLTYLRGNPRLKHLKILPPYPLDYPDLLRKTLIYPRIIR